MIADMTRFAPLALAAPLILVACVAPGPELPPVGAGSDSRSVVTNDTCGAGAFAGLIGQPRSVLDATILPEDARVVFVDDAMTTDFDETRITVVIDGNTDIERVFCG